MFIYQEHFYHNHDGFLEYRIKKRQVYPVPRHERRPKRKSDQSCVEAAMEVEDVLLNQEEEVAQEKVNAS